MELSNNDKLLTSNVEIQEGQSMESDIVKDADTGQPSPLPQHNDVSESVIPPVNSKEIESGSDDLREEQVEKVESELTVNEMSMLERLVKNPDVIAKSQQRGEPDLTSKEKLDALRTIYCSFPVQFLVKFGKHLIPADSVCFDKLRECGNYEVSFHLDEIKKSWMKGSNEKRLKNRRYEALKKLVETTDYFSEEEMQRRNPILYEQLIGRYQTDEEREAFLRQSWVSTSGSGTTSMPLTDLFLAHLERSADGNSCRRIAQETQQDEEDEADAEYYSDDDYDMESPQPCTSTSHRKSPKKPTINDEPQRVEIEDEEKELFKEEFFTTMYRNFLNGKDEDFDYSTVDDNPEYDCGENLDNDEEEKYFDDEEPCTVSEASSDQDDLFKPPIRSSEIESKIEKLSVSISASQSREAQEESMIADLDEEEDALDVYMKEIEKQLDNVKR